MILLHTTKYGDSTLILHGYTREAGRQSFMLRGVGKKNTKSMGYLHPLSILDIQTSESAKGNAAAAVKGAPSGGKILYLREFSPRFPLNSLRSNIYKNSIALYISELLYKSLLETERDVQLYDFLEKSIVLLNSLESNFANFHLWFTIEFASALGFMPGKGFSAEFDPFKQEEEKILKTFMDAQESSDFAAAMQIPLNGRQRTEFISSLLRYLEYHLGTKLNIKSLDVLHQVLTA